LWLNDLFVIIRKFSSKRNVSSNFRLILYEEMVNFSRECKLIRFISLGGGTVLEQTIVKNVK